MSSNQDQIASAVTAASINNHAYHSSSAGRAGGDKLRQGYGTGASGATNTSTTAAAAATPSPQRPRHHFTRSLSELSSPLRLRRQSHGQSQGQTYGHSPSPSHGHIPSSNHTQNQSQSRRNNSVRDHRDGSSSTITSAHTQTGNSSATPASPSHSPRLTPLSKSRTTGGMGATLTSAALLTGNYSLPPHDAGNVSGSANPASSNVSPNTSRRPSVHANKDYNYNTNDMQSPQPMANEGGHHHHHHRHHHHHHHHSISTSNTAGYMSSHSTTIAALAAAATAVAAASPTTQAPAMQNAAHQAETEGDRSQDELQLQQHTERQASTTSAGLPIDPAAVRAAAAALERMQREQSRSAVRVLQSAVTDLDGMSTATSQRLDAAYGSVLTRLGALQDTVLALRSLAAAARATNRRFTAETESIAHDITQQVDQLEAEGPSKESKDGAPVLTPADQQRRLEELSTRVHKGRKAIQDLADRVETARSRVQRWERADRAWQERTRTRLKALWVIVSSVVLVLVVLLAMMMRHNGHGDHDGGSGVTIDAAPEAPEKSSFPPGFSEIASMATPSGKFHLTFPNGTVSNTKTEDGDGTAAGQDDPLQRLFDEL